ncbi:Stk1 family PASTA domain-containing Ser/Thr kinase [Granulicatella elegans]|uniref:Stk1 family PASTA domain-containing Ser/Thr kinase n=1 Tax=Granulicatella elegans TaxID=137732 RepID=UPI001D151525|nr:Stk1 family PASTA domain-containing Ser/Thr kinase [Granulicatella elegans]UEA30813.1 Stk1 family PASTA domain-containing Ser/Thr kinase [Granulicatella elegans]
MLEAGKTLNGRYKIQTLIGTGGMAAVYLAKDLILDRLVAIKVLRLDFRQNNDAMRRFRREALSATQLTHPNIVGVYDVGQSQEMNYIVMEYVEGTDLKDYIRQSGALHPIEAVRIMMQIVSAIAAAHQNRIIHRDIKPQNILIDREGNVKITDFGIAVALSDTSLTQTNTLLGSVHYLSPEQARGGMATIQTDIYALGIVLYELLTGRVPFDGESAVSIALKHFQEPLPPVVNPTAMVPQSLENIVLKATAKDPMNRYRSCYEMFQDLKTCLDSTRLYEKKFVPTSFSGETKVLSPITTQKIKPIQSSREIPVVEMDEEKPVKKKRKWPWLLLLMISVIGIMTFVFLRSSPKEVQVPDVTNLTEAAAKIKLADAKLSVTDVIQVQSDEIESGKVIETNPKAGSTVKEKSKVTIKVSSGKEAVIMKDYRNKTYEAARDELKKLGFTVEKKEENSDSVEAGKVISQSIAPNQKVEGKDTVITLVVSKGETSIKMANLKGYTREGAIEYANTNNLNLTITEEENDATVDTVISQSIREGSNIKKGTPLTIVLSKGKKAHTVTKQIMIPYQKSANNSNGKVNKISIYIEDSVNQIQNVYKTLEITEDTSVNITFNLNNTQSTGKYKIVSDGKEIASGTVQ